MSQDAATDAAPALADFAAVMEVDVGDGSALIQTS